ncbi:MAG TPA: right-handed parallel beta-helix repeat-containing protein [Spirochaetia bacterium]|nr:right-handed parallel beta-helix repeat-containing protein [Spirochaetia bacterium]
MRSARSALIALLPALVLIGCCALAAPAMRSPGPEGLSDQRALIEDTFAGTDLRSDSQALADFQSGLRDSVSAAWWGWDEVDATASLQASFDSGARVIVVPAMGKPWTTRPLFVRSGSTIVFQEGAEVTAMKGSFRGIDNALFSLQDAENVTLSGYGARLSMRKIDYRESPYEHSEWRHAIQLYGCARVTVLGLQIESSGGDGVYLGRGELTFNEAITLRDLRIRDNYRQGISVISAQDLRIENVEISSTEGTLPSAGIDFEPNCPDERIVSCTVANSTIRCNAGPGILVNLHAFTKVSQAVEIRVEHSTVSNYPLALMLVRAGKARGRIELLDTSVSGLQIVGFGSGVKLVRL